MLDVTYCNHQPRTLPCRPRAACAGWARCLPALQHPDFGRSRCHWCCRPAAWRAAPSWACLVRPLLGKMLMWRAQTQVKHNAPRHHHRAYVLAMNTHRHSRCILLYFSVAAALEGEALPTGWKPRACRQAS